MPHGLGLSAEVIRGYAAYREGCHQRWTKNRRICQSGLCNAHPPLITHPSSTRLTILQMPPLLHASPRKTRISQKASFSLRLFALSPAAVGDVKRLLWSDTLVSQLPITRIGRTNAIIYAHGLHPHSQIRLRALP